MLHLEEFVEIGHLRKGHGYQGHARIEIVDLFYDIFLQQQFLFLEIDGYKVPFFIEEIQEQRHLIVKLQYINSPEDLLPFHRLPIYLFKGDVEHLSKDTEELISASRWLGWEVRDSTIGKIGIIDRIEEYPQQFMGIIIYNSRKVLIPLHDSLIVRSDAEHKILQMDLPEGLLQL